MSDRDSLTLGLILDERAQLLRALNENQQLRADVERLQQQLADEQAGTLTIVENPDAVNN